MNVIKQLNRWTARRSVTPDFYAGYTAYMLQCMPRLQELCAAMLVNGSSGVTGMLVTQVLRPGVARITQRRPPADKSVIKNDLAAE